MSYDIFISYAHEDKEWAEKLHRELERRSFEVFRDTTEIRAGSDWSKRLESAIVESTHLVALWSDKVKKSSWVHKELAKFELAAKESKERKLIQVSLNGINDGYKDRQSVSELEKPYTSGETASNVDIGAWETAISKIEKGLEDDRPLIHLIVLACLQDEMEGIPDAEKPTKNSDTFEDFAKRYYQSKTRLLKNYNESRLDWQPYGAETIMTLLDGLRADLIGDGGPPFRWKHVPNSFWTGSDETVLRQIERWGEDELPCLVVTDLFSLYHGAVSYRFNHLIQNVSACSAAAFSLVTPLGTDLRNNLALDLKAATNQLFRAAHYMPYKKATMLGWTCDPMTADPWALRRLLGQTVQAATKTKHWATKMRLK